MTIIDIIVVLNLAAGSSSPKSVYDVFNAREEDGQEYYFVAADQMAIRTRTEPVSLLNKLLGREEESLQVVNAI